MITPVTITAPTAAATSAAIASTETVTLVGLRVSARVEGVIARIASGVAMVVVAVTAAVGLAFLGSSVDMLSLMKLLTDGSAHDSELLLRIEVGVFLATVEHLAEGTKEHLVRGVETSKTIGVTESALRCVLAARTCA